MIEIRGLFKSRCEAEVFQGLELLQFHKILGITRPRAAPSPRAAPLVPELFPVPELPPPICCQFSYMKRKGKAQEQQVCPPCRLARGCLAGMGGSHFWHAGPSGENWDDLPTWRKK